MEIVLPKKITYKELMLVYGLDQAAAHKKLWVIRGVLGKAQRQAVLIQEFCLAENVAKEIFVAELKNAYTDLYQKPQKQLSISFK